MIMFPSMESFCDLLKDSPKDSLGSVTSSRSLKRKNILSQIKKLTFAASVPEMSSSEESNIPRSTNVDTNLENDFLYNSLKFPNLKGSRTTPEDSKDSAEQVSLGEILSIIEPVSKQMEKDKKTKAEPFRTRSLGYNAEVERIGPHFDIYHAFQHQLGKRKDKMSRKILKAIILIQGVVRGWLERRRLARVIAKSRDHGPNFRAVVNAYRRMIDRIQRRAGLRNTRVTLNFSELEEWLDRKKFYEVMFAKRETGQGIPKQDLPKYFRDCGHFPTQSHIDSTFLLVQKYNEVHSEEVKKAKALEMIFTLYPPEGAHVSHFWGLKSTWTRPIVRGEEAYKYIVSGHPIIKKADIRVVGKLVARSMRERRMKIRFKTPD